MDHAIEVLLDIAKSRDARVESVIETARLREGHTKFHEISSTEARERAILRFLVHSYFVVSRCGHATVILRFTMRRESIFEAAGPSLKVLPAVTLVDG